MKNMNVEAVEPIIVKNNRILFFDGDESVKAPTKGRIITCKSTEAEITYSKNDSAYIGKPKICNKPLASAQVLAIAVRYGFKKTASIDVENAETAQSYIYQADL
jgi:hypothetical protein